MHPEARRGSCASAAVVAVLAAACGGPPPASQFPSADDALNRLYKSYECAYGVRGTAKIDLVTKKGRVKTDVDLTAVSPESVRFDVVTPGIMSLLYTLTSDGKTFKFNDQEQKVFYVGPAKQCNLARFTRVEVPPHALVSVARGLPPVLVHDAGQTTIQWDDDHYVVRVDSKHQAKQEIHLEVHPDDFDKKWSEQRLRLRRVRVEQGGNDLYDVELDDHKPRKTSAPIVDEDGIDPDVPPSGPECNAELPHTIRFVVKETKDDVLWNYKDDVFWNPPLLEGTFDQKKPGGMVEQFSDCQ
ncbi:MAG: hypothetical protein HOW73_06335 [Polyangiaceae bacterium]|nr:hypothetical protein [Polyangiaceae bacterium]